MAFPNVLSITESSVDSNETSHAVSMPATVNAGDLLLCWFGVDGNPTVTTPSGWSLLRAGTNGMAVHVFAKRAAGTEGGTTVDFVTSVSERAVAQVYRIEALTYSGVSPVTGAAEAIDTFATGLSSAPDVGSFNPSGWGTLDTLWIAGYVTNAGATLSNNPSGYTPGEYTDSDSTSAGVSMGTAYLEATAESENPGAWTISTIGQWVAGIVAVRGMVITTLTPTAASLTVTTSAPNLPTATVLRPAAASLTVTTSAPDVAQRRILPGPPLRAGSGRVTAPLRAGSGRTDPPLRAGRGRL